MIEATQSNEIDTGKKLDLVLSLISWGFHYPVGVYLDRVYELLNDDGRLILDVRTRTDGLNVLTQKFGSYEVILETAKYARVAAKKVRKEV